MATVAEQLRSTRERKKLTIYQVADATKIKTDHIRALDAGNFDVFSAPVYIKGFVRSYANFLKLDTPAVMRDLEAELTQTKKFREPPSLLGKRSGFFDPLLFQISRLDWRIALALIVTAIIVGASYISVRVWRHHRAKDPLVGLKPGLYQPAPKAADVYLDLPPAPPR